jgi:acetyltransferase-like isoleucine patch superfamily enzyme
VCASVPCHRAGWREGRIGENSWIAPSVSVINKVNVGKNTMTGIGAVIVKNTEENLTYIGNPAIRMDEYKKWSEVRKKLLG